jgi:hypothetical protein
MSHLSRREHSPLAPEGGGMNAPALRVVSPDGEIPQDGPQTMAEALALLATYEDTLHGHEQTIAWQSGKIGRLERELREETDPQAHPQRAEIQRLIERWRRGTKHPRAKVSKDRIDLVRGRLKDGYSIEEIELAIDGLAALPYVRNGQRVREGHASELHDRLGIALGGGEQLEKFAVLGHKARKAGWVDWGTDAA